MKKCYFLLGILLIAFDNVRAQTVPGQSWFSYGNTAMGGYSWTNAALTTNSIEILNNIGTVNNLSPTLAFHRYGTGGPQFRLAADGSNVLYLESSGYNSARNPNPYGGGPNNYFTRLHVDAGLTTTGNVGIGTASPSTTLEVNGTFKVASGGNQLVFNGYSDLTMNCPARGSGGRAVVHDFGNTLTLNYAGDFSGDTRLGSQTYFSENPNGTSFVSGGNLGVGTTDTHGYKLAVNGNIHTQEVRVDMNGWPDFVFKPVYRLASLNSVATYIAKNGHLPEMPSAAEVEKQGVNLGEMNRLLLKKVEELTLYLIELKKDNERLTGRVKKMEKRK